MTFFTALLFFFSGGWAARLQRFTCCGDDLSSWLSTHVSSGHWRALSGSLTRKQGKPPAYTQDAQPCKLNMHLSKKVLIKIPNRGREVHSRMYAEKMYSHSARRRFSVTREAKYLARENVWPLSFFFRTLHAVFFCFVFFLLSSLWLLRTSCSVQDSRDSSWRGYIQYWAYYTLEKKSFAVYRTGGVVTSSVKSDAKHSVCVCCSPLCLQASLAMQSC